MSKKIPKEKKKEDVEFWKPYPLDDEALHKLEEMRKRKSTPKRKPQKVETERKRKRSLKKE